MMYALKDTQKDAYVAAFFIGINLFVSTLVLNMFIAVISAAFGQARAAQDEQEKKSEADKRASAFSYETVGEARLKKRQGCCRRFCPCLPCCHCLQEEVAEVDPDAEDEEVLVSVSLLSTAWYSLRLMQLQYITSSLSTVFLPCLTPRVSPTRFSFSFPATTASHSPAGQTG